VAKARPALDVPPDVTATVSAIKAERETRPVRVVAAGFLIKKARRPKPTSPRTSVVSLLWRLVAGCGVPALGLIHLACIAFRRSTVTRLGVSALLLTHFS
jgi:hypothetical protein